MDRTGIRDLVAACLHDVLEEQDALPADPLTDETRLLGRAAVLDSLGLVRLILEVEQRLAEAHEVHVTLADERAMSQAKSPFRTVGTFSDYVATLIDEAGAHGGR